MINIPSIFLTEANSSCLRWHCYCLREHSYMQYHFARTTMVTLMSGVCIVLSSFTIYIYMVPLKCLAIANSCINVSIRDIVVLSQVQVEFTTRANLNYMSTSSSKDSILTCYIHLITFTIAEAIIFMLYTIYNNQVQSIDDTITISLSKLLAEGSSSGSSSIILTIFPSEHFTLTDDNVLSCIDCLRQHLHIQRKDCIYTT